MSTKFGGCERAELAKGEGGDRCSEGRAVVMSGGAVVVKEGPLQGRCSVSRDCYCIRRTLLPAYNDFLCDYNDTFNHLE